VKCLSCGLVFLKNKPNLEKLDQEVYSDKEYFNELYLQNTTQQIEDGNRLLNHIAFYKNSGKVLDIGCGRGYFLYTCKQRNWDTYGIEIAKEEAKFAEDKFGLKVFPGPIEEAGDFLKDKLFDLIVMNASLEHMLNPDDILKIAHSRLKNDGIIFIWVPNLVNSILHIFRRKKDLAENIPYHINYFNTKNLKVLLQRNNFEVIDLRTEMITAISGNIFGTLKSISRVFKKTTSSPCADKKEAQIPNNSSENKSIKDKIRAKINKLDSKITFGSSIIVFAKKRKN